jgi:hypothetical protein
MADNATDRIVLAELQGAEQTAGDGWTSEAPTYSNTHSITLSNFIGTGGDAVYRRMDGVRENVTDYTERASAALVDANASSWYYDEATTKMYVRTSSGSDPDLFTSILVFFSLFTATTAKDFAGGELWEPMLVGALPVVRLEAENILFGIKIVDEGSLDLQNAHSFWDTTSQNYIWKNKKVTFYLGGGTLALTDYEKIAVMRIEDVAVGDTMAVFRLKHMLTALDKILPLNTFSKTDDANLGDGLDGSYKPIVWGYVRDVPCKLVDSTAGANYWLVSDIDVHALTEISNVRAVDSNGVKNGLTEGIHYSQSLVTNRIYVYDTDYDAQNYSIICDAKGKTDGASSYLKKWAEISQDILELQGEATADFDASSFTTADSDNGNEIALYVSEPKTTAEYLQDIQRSVRGYLYISREGEWTAQVWLPYGMAGETADSLSDEDFVTWVPEDKLETNYHEVVVRYGRNPHTGEWKERSASNSLAQFELERSDVARIDTLLVNKSNALRHAQRLLLTLKQPSIQVALQQRGLDSLLKHGFERLLITRSRAPDIAGAWTDEPVEILEVSKTLAPPGVGLRIRRIGLSDRGDRIRAWASTGIPDYDAASGAQQEAYAFWHDSNGEVGVGNVENHSVWY